MVTRGRARWAGAVVLAALVAGSTCKVVNEDHCANQDVPGNQFCRELNLATPYCSPCNRDYHGCVDFEPYACGGYPDEVATTTDATASSTSDPSGTGSDSGSGTPGSSG